MLGYAHRLVFLAALAATPLFAATPLCERILAVAARADAADSKTLAVFAATLSEFSEAKERSKAKRDPRGPYDALFLEPSSEETLVRLPGSSLTFAVELPKPGTPSVWESLTGDERAGVLAMLEEDLATTTLYDERAAEWQRIHREGAAAIEERPGDPEFEEFVRRIAGRSLRQYAEDEAAARRASGHHDSLEEAAIDYAGRWVLSPRLILTAGRATEIVCRHANKALGAALLELGAPLDAVRIVNGSRGSERHQWGEARPAEDWREFDGTPLWVRSYRSRSSPARLLFDELLGISSRRRTRLRDAFVIDPPERHFEIVPR